MDKDKDNSINYESILIYIYIYRGRVNKQRRCESRMGQPSGNPESITYL